MVPQGPADKAALVQFLATQPLHRRIALLRGMKSYTQEQLAQELQRLGLGTKRWTVGGWEADPTESRHHRPGKKARRALAQVFGLTESELFLPIQTGNDAHQNPGT